MAGGSLHGLGACYILATLHVRKQPVDGQRSQRELVGIYEIINNNVIDT